MNINTDFEIFPYSGAGLLSFGMKIQDVENLIGPPDNISKNHLNQRVEFRSFMNVGYTAQDPASLNHIGFGRQMIGVRYRNIMLLKENESTVLKKLYDEDSQAFIYLGFVIFINLGITLTGFHDEDVNQKAVAVFPHGIWDRRISKLKPFSL